MQQESGRLRLAELSTLADGLNQRGALLRQECRQVLDAALKDLERLCVATNLELAELVTTAGGTCDRERNQLESLWAETDAAIEELTSQASNEISSFVTQAEAIIGACERRMRRELEQAKLVRAKSRSSR